MLADSWKLKIKSYEWSGKLKDFFLNWGIQVKSRQKDIFQKIWLILDFWETTVTIIKRFVIFLVDTLSSYYLYFAKIFDDRASSSSGKAVVFMTTRNKIFIRLNLLFIQLELYRIIYNIRQHFSVIGTRQDCIDSQKYQNKQSIKAFPSQFSKNDWPSCRFWKMCEK